jgi:hypothetical protein
MNKDQHIAYIKNVHPDLDELIKSREYLRWFVEQHPKVRKAILTGTAAEVVAVLNLYRLENPPVEQNKE